MLFFGASFENLNLNDEVEYQNVSNTMILSYYQRYLGRIGFMAKHQNLNYGYRTILVNEDQTIPNRLKNGYCKLRGNLPENV